MKRNGRNYTFYWHERDEKALSRIAKKMQTALNGNCEKVPNEGRIAACLVRKSIGQLIERVESGSVSTDDLINELRQAGELKHAPVVTKLPEVTSAMKGYGNSQ